MIDGGTLDEAFKRVVVAAKMTTEQSANELKRLLDLHAGATSEDIDYLHQRAAQFLVEGADELKKLPWLTSLPEPTAGGVRR
jgi:hypothetical protein